MAYSENGHIILDLTSGEKMVLFRAVNNPERQFSLARVSPFTAAILLQLENTLAGLIKLRNLPVLLALILLDPL